MKTPGYFRYPSIHNDTVVFVSEDDVWTVPASGGVARRLTSGLGMATHPALSPDGKWLAFSGRDEGNPEVYVMPAQGGEARRLTFLGANSSVIGWHGDEILFNSDAQQPFRPPQLWRVSRNGGAPQRLPFGPATHISYGPSGGCVIGRNAIDPARWKRYRGGTAGDLWIDPTGAGNFRRLIELKGNPSRPMWIGARIYFLSDHEGVGNLYSCTPTGKDLQKHTHHEDFYVRHPATDGRRIVYHAGADLFVYDGGSRKLEIEYDSPRTQRNRKFVGAAKHLESFAPHPQGHLLALTARGKCFTMGNWEGPVTQHGHDDTVRYRLARWLNDGQRIVVVSDAGGEETLEIHSLEGRAPSRPRPARTRRSASLQLGRVVELRVSPQADAVVLSNHRNELVHVDLKTGKSRVLEKSEWAPIAGFDWSPDGRWVAYSWALSLHTSQIKICEVKTGKCHVVTRPVLRDEWPTFDPEGKYLYFLSYREFDPVYDALHFDLGFPRGVKPYLVTLRKDLPSPFVPVPKPPEEKKDEPKKKPKPVAVDIDFDGIETRVLAFPVSDRRYQQVAGLPGKVLMSWLPVEGALSGDFWPPSPEPPAKATLELFDFETQKAEKIVGEISRFELSADRKTLVYRAGNKLRALKAGEKPDEALAKEPPGKKSGWIDLERVKVSVRPGEEWRQMYREAWRMQRDHFWTPDMSKIDWQAVYDRYLPLVERVATRAEFSDLMWEMQGELGTSHAYEFGGDYRLPPKYDVGLLGADFAYDEKAKAWRITHIVAGDPWDESKRSPLAAPGLNIREGDLLTAIGGRRLDANTHPNELLVNQARSEVLVTIGKRTVTVKTLGSEQPVRYREWVETNRAIVHERSGGRVGYVHVPDMGPAGYSEFHRYFLSEIDREGLIVDVRYNGGGHVSELLLEKLARRRIGYDQSRWFNVSPYPVDSVLGPMVALTNEFAGSDGDIFSHGFKLLKLGPLIGKRTWGGVVGIWPRHHLADGTFTTQPEFSFWFKDVGWRVENYGTDPNVEVEFRPQDYVAGRDPQLERALREVTGLLRKHPPKRPDLTQRPNLSLPRLPR
jgi:tricorn protease